MKKMCNLWCQVKHVYLKTIVNRKQTYLVQTKTVFFTTHWDSVFAQMLKGLEINSSAPQKKRYFSQLIGPCFCSDQRIGLPHGKLWKWGCTAKCLCSFFGVFSVINVNDFFGKNVFFELIEELSPNSIVRSRTTMGSQLN